MSTTTLPPTKKTEPVSAPKGGITDRARGERKLGWMLAGPAFVVLPAVPPRPLPPAIYEKPGGRASDLSSAVLRGEQLLGARRPFPRPRRPSRSRHRRGESPTGRAASASWVGGWRVRPSW